MEPGMGIEPTTPALRKPCSTADLPRPAPARGRSRRPGTLPHAPCRRPPVDARGRPLSSGPVHYHVDGYNLAHWLAGGDDDMQPLALRKLLTAALRARVPRDAESVHVYWDVRRPSPGLPS